MAITDRSNIAALIDQENQNKLWEEAAKESFALRHATKVPMSSDTMKLRQVLSVNTPGVFLNGDSARKPTYNMDFENKTLTAEEIAGNYVFEEASLEDSSFDLLGQARKFAAEKIALAVDYAVFRDVGSPASWADGLSVGATAASQVVDLANYTGGAAADDDLARAYSDLLGLVEDNDHNASAILARTSQKRALRTLRDGNGAFIYDGVSRQLWDTPVEYVDNGSFGANVADSVQAITGDFSKAVIGIRTAVEFKLLTEATLTEDVVITNGTDPDQTVRQVAYSLAEQDLLAIRFRVRLAFQVMTPSSTVGGVNPYPFAVMIAA